MGYLDNINNPDDLKKLNIDELNYLACEIREFLINSISKTGGHLSSNLGVVELTLALNFVFDFSRDKIIWDVGHQSYTHKILTGRKSQFDTLRKKDGISGFPKTTESIYDHFNTGHSSTSISAGLGFATGRDLSGQNFEVVSVIGDGAMTGGIVYEAINNAGANNKKMLIILNDNQMSIDENVGSLTNHLSNLRLAPKYIDTKLDIKNFLSNQPILGDGINKMLEKIKEGVKHAMLPNVMFEQLGLKYIGPLDGHDIEMLIKTLGNIKNINKPVLLHVITTKGIGYKPAQEKPKNYHGISSFDLETGEVLSKGAETYSDIFSQFIVKKASSNKKIVAITAAMPSGTGLSLFAKLYPERFFDVGIAEEHAVIFSAGLASTGYIPIFAVYSTFLQRSYDQIIHDVCLQNLKVIFAIDRAGIVGDDGETHQGIFDLSYLSHIPNLTILAPKNGTELNKMLDYAVSEHNGAIAIRYPRGSALISEFESDIKFCESELIRSGEKILIVSVGTMFENVMKSCEKLILDGHNPTVVNARFVSPIADNLIEMIANNKNNYEYIFTIEDNLVSGGFGEKLTSSIMKHEIFNKKIYNIGFPNEYIEHSTKEQLFEKYGLNDDGIYKYIISKIQ